MGKCLSGSDSRRGSQELSRDGEVAFDPFEPGFVASPYEQYARLRAHDPVHWSALLEGWVLTRYDDVVALLRDPAMSVELDRATATARRRAEPGAPAGQRAADPDAGPAGRPGPPAPPPPAPAPVRRPAGRGAASPGHRPGGGGPGRRGAPRGDGRGGRLRVPAAGGGVQRDAGPARRGRAPGPGLDRGGGPHARPPHRRRRARPVRRARGRDVRLPRRPDRGQAPPAGRRRAHGAGPRGGGRRPAEPRRARWPRSSRCTSPATSRRCR